MRRAMAVLGLAGLLVACGGGEEEFDAPQEAPLAGGEEIEAPTEAGDKTAEAADTETATPAGEIPSKYLGVWDYVGSTCAEGSDMRMDIEARKIQFYESTGNVTGTGEDAGDAVVDLAMSGEGEEWIESMRFSLVQTPDGEQLHVSDATKPKVKDEYPRKRCPA